MKTTLPKENKRDAMSRLVGDAFYERANKMSVLAATVDLLSKGTKHRTDALEIIKGCYPDYFKNHE